MSAPFPEIENVSGIYEIYCIPSGKSYIGSAVNIRQRRNIHFHHLRQGTHHSIALQRAWNVYGEGSFQVHILERVEKERLFERENYWFEKRKAERGNHGYNMAPIAESCLGYKHSPETVQHMRAAGRKRSERGLTENQRAAYAMRKERGLTEADWLARQRRKEEGVTENQRAAYQRMQERGQTEAQIAANASRRGRPLTPKQEAWYSRKRGMKVSAETRAKQSEGLRAAWAKRSPEETQRISAKVSAAIKGKSNPNISVAAKRRADAQTEVRIQQLLSFIREQNWGSLIPYTASGAATLLAPQLKFNVRTTKRYLRVLQARGEIRLCSTQAEAEAEAALTNIPPTQGTLFEEA